ncbi:MAG: transporter, ATP-binding protein [Bacteroidetes bacterium]|jgi:ATP-binding cassette subfamily B protein|nr:transporter, ATP-binding protein [Bacteroidota bacterium]
MPKFPHYKQTDSMTCGPTCLRIISAYYGKDYSLSYLVQISHTNREGSSLLSLCEAAEKIGFRTLGTKIHLSQLSDELALPCIAHWNQQHFIVIYKVKNNKIYVSDPAHGLLVYGKEEFRKCWVSDGKDEGILLLLEPSPEFYQDRTVEDVNKEKKVEGFSFLSKYLLQHKRLILQLILGLCAGSLLQLIFPFFTQSIVDIGIKNQDVKFIYLILFAQLMAFFARTTIEIIRSWILLHISSRINISLVSDFFVKLMKLPISFFDTKMTGDIMQRISDHYRIESFLTGTSLSVLFSMFNLLIFSFVLAWYNVQIFAVFIIGSILYVAWILFFLKYRADLDFKRFQQNSQNQSKVIELINGMQEIKLHNAERQKRWQWESLQVKLFKINIQGLALSQWQNSGSSIINELKNIIITFLTAKLVLDGKITLGMMLSVSYITGQLNAPIIELVQFIQHWQDAKLSLQRLAEIHNKDDEETEYDNLINVFKQNSNLEFKNVNFHYPGVNDLVLKELSITIPANKVTAIVGSSGSGKTTLMKMLLKFYEPTNGDINLGQQNLKHISAKTWRNKCGVVMQEGYIFNDTIASNIAVGDDVVDKEKLIHAVTVANIKEFIENLPLGYYTKIGIEGNGISTGQKQRILIARAVYKNPDYLFFDEATSALDANNEKTIMSNLSEFFKGKTVVVIAHRLSTVKNADQIIVLEKGQITEKGHHLELTAQRGDYYELVKNQLELGN